MKTLLALALALCLLCTAAVAQSAPTVSADAPFAVEWNHDGLRTTGYRVRLDGAEIANVPIAALVSGTASFTVAAGVSTGDHTVSVSAYGTGGEGPPLSLVFTARALPPNPLTSLRLK
jgi:hypothetical protein